MHTPILGPTIETERLVLRPPSAADFDAWAAFMADEEAARYIGGPVERSHMASDGHDDGLVGLAGLRDVFRA